MPRRTQFLNSVSALIKLRRGGRIPSPLPLTICWKEIIEAGHRLVIAATKLYLRFMRLVRNPCMRRVVSGLMLLATAAFLQHGTLAVASQAAAAAGIMPEPAQLIAGSVHVHGKVTGHVHSHSGQNAAGHTHDHAHDDGMDEPASTLFWALGGLSAVLSQAITAPVAFSAVCARQAVPSDRSDGIVPDGLSRPPSTPSIA